MGAVLFCTCTNTPGSCPLLQEVRPPPSSVAPAPDPESQVNSIIWPNVEFDCGITVYGPEVKALVKRYLEQMIGGAADPAIARVGNTSAASIPLAIHDAVHEGVLSAPTRVFNARSWRRRRICASMTLGVVAGGGHHALP